MLHCINHTPILTLLIMSFIRFCRKLTTVPVQSEQERGGRGNGRRKESHTALPSLSLVHSLRSWQVLTDVRILNFCSHRFRRGQLASNVSSLGERRRRRRERGEEEGEGEEGEGKVEGIEEEQGMGDMQWVWPGMLLHLCWTCSFLLSALESVWRREGDVRPQGVAVYVSRVWGAICAKNVDFTTFVNIETTYTVGPVLETLLLEYMSSILESTNVSYRYAWMMLDIP